jgi:hypothetical protein
MFGMCMYVRSDRPFLPGTYEAFAQVANVHNLGADEQISRERLAFKRYQDYFDVPSEI